MGDFDFSINFGVSQSRAGDVVEKHRANGTAEKDVVVRPVIAPQELVPPSQLVFPKISPAGRTDAS